MGLCFSFQQQRDVERIFSYLNRGSAPSQEQNHDEDEKCVPTESTSEISQDETKLQPSYESKQVQVNLTPPPSPSPTSLPQPPAPASEMTEEQLAREERRRKRDERRAARAKVNQEKPKELNNVDKSPLDHLEDRCRLDVHTFHAFDPKKKCLVLDIDYTIFDHKSDFDLALEYKRPYLHEFLKICSAYYNIVIWSATAYFHIQTKMEKLELFNHPDFQICLVLSKDHMIPHAFSIRRKTYVQDIKPLALLWMKYPEVFNPNNTIHIDDVEENFVMNPHNGLRIEPFRDALLFRQTDRELFYLAQYLSMIADLSSFEPLNHCRWKDYIINILWSMQTVISLPTFTPPLPPSSHLLEIHQQSLLIKQRMRESAKEKEREEREKAWVEREIRKMELDEELRKRTTAEGGVIGVEGKVIGEIIIMEHQKEATEEELIKLANAAMRPRPPKSPQRSKQSPRITSPKASQLQDNTNNTNNTINNSNNATPKTPQNQIINNGYDDLNKNISQIIQQHTPNHLTFGNQKAAQPSLYLNVPSPQQIPRSPRNRSKARMDEKEKEKEKEVDDWRHLTDKQLLEVLRHPAADSFIPLSLPLPQIS